MLKSRLPEIAASLDDVVKDVLEEGAQTIAEAARQRVPVDTGNLQDAIHVESARNGAYVIAGDTDAFYGHIVEFGSVEVPPRPFLVPALEENRAPIIALAKRWLAGL
jgi:HK97 gp10 family phage protein